jgi:hypothetical protein
MEEKNLEGVWDQTCTWQATATKTQVTDGTRASKTVTERVWCTWSGPTQRTDERLSLSPETNPDCQDVDEETGDNISHTGCK